MRFRRSPVVSFLVAMALTVVAVVGAAGLAASQAVASNRHRPRVPAASGHQAYRIVGNEFVDPNGQQFIPYGFVLYCLALVSLSCEHASSSDPNTDSDRIRAAATFWHANTVRIQVAPEHLFSVSPDDTSYVAALDGEVHLANKLGMVAIVTMQTEQFRGPPLPTNSAIRFWRYMAKHYEHEPMVFFDLYNEPRLTPRLGADWMWSLWRNGGTDQVKGRQETFVGMQRLVHEIRHAGAHNVIIAEGNQGDHDLSLLPEYRLTGSNIAYGTEPDLTSSDSTPAEWAANWGTLSNSLPIAMEAFQDWPGTAVCNPDSPTLMPQLLGYLSSKHLGLIAWSLAGGNLIEHGQLDQPTTFAGASVYDCSARSSTSSAAPASTGRHHHPRHAGIASGSSGQQGTAGPGALDPRILQRQQPSGLTRRRSGQGPAGGGLEHLPMGDPRHRPRAVRARGGGCDPARPQTTAEEPVSMMQWKETSRRGGPMPNVTLRACLRLCVSIRTL